MIETRDLEIVIIKLKWNIKVYFVLSKYQVCCCRLVFKMLGNLEMASVQACIDVICVLYIAHDTDICVAKVVNDTVYILVAGGQMRSYIAWQLVGSPVSRYPL